MINKICFNSFFLVLSILFAVNSVFAQVNGELEKCKTYLTSFPEDLRNKDIGTVIQNVAQSFIGVKYEAGTLDKNTDEEKLVVKVTGFDCVTFVETVLAMSMTLKEGKTDIDNFKKNLRLIRYRNGQIEDYTSRLHYFTDWIFDNEKKGLVRDITQDIGGIPYEKKIDFMSSHIKSYKQLSKNKKFVKEIKKIEKDISERRIYYIPKSDVELIYDKLQSGDIIATTTNIEGLDVSHTGFVYKSAGKTRFLHASISKMEIIITDEQLMEYLEGNKKQTGIIVARPLN